MDAIEGYIAQFPSDVQTRLHQMRTIIRTTAPQAIESISYAMPAYKLQGKPLVYFAGYPNHIGFYATPVGYEPFQSELAKYKQGKGSVQFPHSQPLPVELITRIVEFRVATVINIPGEG